MRLGHQSWQESSRSLPAGPWACDTVFTCLNLPERGMPVDRQGGGRPACSEDSCLCLQRCPGKGRLSVAGKAQSDCIRQAAIDLVPVYPRSLISINSSLEELARDPRSLPAPFFLCLGFPLEDL